MMPNINLQSGLSKDKYVQIVLIIAIVFILYKIISSGIFKGLGTAVQGLGEGIGTAGTGVGEGISTVATSTAKIYQNYAELVASVPTKLGTWSGLIDDPKNKPWLDLYENLPWSKVPINYKPFFVNQKIVVKKLTDDYIKKNIAIPIKEAEGTFSYDEDVILGAIDKLPSWYDFMNLAVRFQPLTNRSLRAYLDKALTEEEKVEVAKIMNSKVLYIISK